MFRSIRNHLTSGRGIAATYALILTLGLGLSVTAPAAASDGQDQQGPKPTIVFVHGGWADSSSWNQEITNLERRDYTVIAPADPLRDLASDAAYIRSVLQTISGPIVLVGHSYGGAVITNAAVGVPNVKALVYIAAFAPDKGESLVQLVTMNPGSQIGPATLDFRPYPLAAIYKRATSALLILGTLAGAMQLLDAGIGLYERDPGKCAGPLFIAALQFFVMYRLHRSMRITPQINRG